MKYHVYFLIIGCIIAWSANPVFSQNETVSIKKDEIGLHIKGDMKIILEAGEYANLKNKKVIIFKKEDSIESFVFHLLDQKGLSFTCTMSLHFSMNEAQVLALANKLGDKIESYKDYYIQARMRSHVRAAFGDYEYHEIESKADQINTGIRQSLDKDFEDLMTIQTLTLKYSK